MNASLTLALLLSSLSLAGCADTGPLSVAKDTYRISVRVPFSGPTGARGQALHEANLFCDRESKQVLLDHENSSECALRTGCGEAEVTFLCLAVDDPRYIAAHEVQKGSGAVL